MRSKRKKKKVLTKRLGILEKVEEAGIERFLSASPAPSSLEGDANNEKFWSSLSKMQSSNYKQGMGKNKFKNSLAYKEEKKYFLDLLSDELEAIEPGTLTVSRGKSAKQLSIRDDRNRLVGQLQPPSATNLSKSYNFDSMSHVNHL